MKKNRYSTRNKAIAAFLSVLCFCALVLSIAAVSLMASGRFYNYSRHRVEQEYYSSQLFAHLSTVVRYYNPYYGDQTLYESPVNSYQNTNLAFTVINGQTNEVIAKTYHGEPTVYEDDVHFLFEVNTGQTLITTADPYSQNYEILLTVKGYILEADDIKEDLFSSTYNLYMLGYTWRYPLIAIAFLVLAALCVLWLYLLYAAGHHNDETKLRGTLLEKIPFDIFSIAYLAIMTVGILLLITVLRHGIINVLTISIMLFIMLCMYLSTLIYSYSLTTRLKIGGFGKKLFFYQCFHFLWQKFRVLLRWIPLIWKTITILLLSLVSDLFMLSYLDHVDQFLLYFIIKNAILAIIIIYATISLRKLQKGGEKIANGDFSYQIETKHLLGNCETFAKTLNTIGDSMSIAVSERMKSERLKTELITNVSHDIKTPLTSIINYIDLLKKENLSNDKAVEYLNILDKQSARMKKLIFDLVEVSKASTGNVKVQIEECDICVLLQQAAGEYHEKLIAAKLEPVTHFSDLPILVMADGALLWRVFDNLLSNICKYSLPGTRVYLDAAIVDTHCVITFKNISKYPLGTSCDELMERFVRGDTSRHTEGSGLGLSIAQSLLALQEGSLSVSSDGDLFKATVVFPLKQDTS